MQATASDARAARMRVLMQAQESVAAALAQRGITIRYTLRCGACVDVTTRTIYVRPLTTCATEKDVNQLRAFIAHEAAHLIAKSTVANLKRAIKGGKLLENIFRAMDDVRVNSIYRKGFFPGARQFILNAMDPKDVEAQERIKHPAIAAIFTMFWEGHEYQRSFAHASMDESLSRKLETIGLRYVAEFVNASSDGVTLRLARKLEREWLPLLQQPTGDDTGTGNDDDDDASDDDTDTTDTGNDSSDDDDTDNDNDDIDTDNNDNDADDADDNDDDNDGNDGNDDDDDTGTGESGDDDDDGSNEPCSDDDGSAADDSASNDDDDNSDDGTPNNGEGSGGLPDMPDMPDLQEMQRESEREQKQRGGDVVKPYQHDARADTVHDLTPDQETAINTDNVLRKAGGLRAKIMQALLSTGDPWHHGQRTGVIEASRIARIALNDNKVFRKRRPDEGYDVAVGILLDYSGSMKQYMRELANTFAVLMQDAFAACSINSAIAAYSTSFRSGLDIGRSGYHLPQADCDPNHCSMGFAKRFRQPISVKSVGRRLHWLKSRLGGTTPTAPALHHMLEDIKAERNQRKIILVVTDGFPDDPNSVKTVLESAALHDVEVVGIGVAGANTSHLFKRSASYPDVESLLTVFYPEFLRALHGE